jgi:hypothetical protein
MLKMGLFADNCLKNCNFAAIIKNDKRIMEATKKRTREEVRAAFRAFMREREEEQKAAQMRSKMYQSEVKTIFA